MLQNDPEHVDGRLQTVAGPNHTMIHNDIYVSPAFRELALDAYPGLRSKPEYWNLFAYLLFPSQVDKDTNLPIISQRTLATLAGRLDAFGHRHFCAEDYIRGYCATTGHTFSYADADYQNHRARAVTNLSLSPAFTQALNDELRSIPRSGQEVTLIEGLRRIRQRDADERRADGERAMNRDAKYAVARKAIAYLNERPVQLFSRAVKKHYAQALAVAGAAINPLRAYQDLITLRKMYVQPKPFYGPSSSSNTARIFVMHRGLGMLSKEVAAVIAQDWITFDLRSSQLAIAAFTWDVPEMIAFLRSGDSIWRRLLADLNLDAYKKPSLKKSMYSLIYGAATETIYQTFAETSEALTSEERVLGELLMEHELMRPMLTARDTQLSRIRQAKGAWDCYGHWLPLRGSDPGASSIGCNERSILAQLAQAVEFKILEPVIDLAMTSRDFSITHWAHDGFSIHVGDTRRAVQVRARIEEAVRASAAAAGVETYLERTHDPFAV